MLFAQKPKTNPLAPKAEPPSQGTERMPSGAGAHELSQSDLEAFLDGMMPLQLAREDIAGAVISVVKDGKVLFARGYGYSDVEKKTPVSAESTLFRPGSISKLFNWTSIMQQVELGKLDLDRDVNDYLDFKIPATFPKPITLRDIMTHTRLFQFRDGACRLHSSARIRGTVRRLHRQPHIQTPGNGTLHRSPAVT